MRKSFQTAWFEITNTEGFYLKSMGRRIYEGLKDCGDVVIDYHTEGMRKRIDIHVKLGYKRVFSYKINAQEVPGQNSEMRCKIVIDYLRELIEAERNKTLHT